MLQAMLQERTEGFYGISLKDLPNIGMESSWSCHNLEKYNNFRS